jgi:peroxiredoxin
VSDPEDEAGPQAPEPKSILDPDRAIAEQRARVARAAPAPAIDTRRYRWAIGVFGIFLVIVISIIQFASNGVKGGGVAAGSRLQPFAAPVATSNLVGDANLSKPCSLGRFGARAVNTCLIVRRTPIVLAFFVTGSGDCTQSVDTVQKVSAEFSASSVRFAAIAVDASQSDTAALVRSHHWTIPVAYDRDGAIGQVYGVQFCPMIELAYRGGIVKDRLIGDNWNNAAKLAAAVRALVASPAGPAKG